MKRVTLTIILALFAIVSLAQSCYQETRQNGVSAFKRGQYKDAKAYFQTAKTCPDKPKNHDLDTWIRKCNDKINSSRTDNIVSSPVKEVDTYIKVDGKSSTSSSHSASGGTEYFNISTDAKSWTTSGVPSWCSIYDKTSSSFSLRVNANSSTNSRSDYMLVRTPNGHTARIDIKQSGKTNATSATIQDVTVSHNQTVGGEDGMTIKMKLNVHGLKDKDGAVAVYFYDENGKALKDKNGKYDTSGGDVATHDNIKPKYDNSEWGEFKLSIPYSELHLSESAGTKSIKFKFIVWDKSTATSKNILSTSLYSTSFYFNPAFLTVDGSATDKTKHFSESGGREIYYVKTSDSSYETWGVPSWCSIESKTSSSFTLVCNRNTSTSSRSDYMKVKAAGKEIRIDITQDANSGPSANIVSVWVEHNVIQYVGWMAVKGMKIHAKFNVNNLLNKQGLIQAFFSFQNGNALNDFNGQYRASNGQVSVWDNFTPNYTNCTFNDYVLFMPYTELHCAGGTSYLTFHLELFEKTSGSWKNMATSSNVDFTYTGF